MSAGWGLPPWGEGDWGGLNTFIPGTREVSLVGSPPVLNRDVIPAGGAKISGSAPVIVSTEFRIRPDSGAIDVLGHAVTVIEDIRRIPAANDLEVDGFAPNVEQSAVLTPPVGTVSLLGAAPIVLDGQVRIPGTADLDLVGQNPELNTKITPAQGEVDVVGFAPTSSEGKVITPTGTALIVGGIPGVVVRGLVKVPDTANLALVGQAPELNTKIVPQTGQIDVAGQLPLVDNAVETNTGSVSVVGVAPSLQTRIFTGQGALNILGRVPGVAISRVITPVTGSIVVAGSAPIIQNPNWVNIDDNQDPSWANINDSQTPNWIGIAA